MVRDASQFPDILQGDSLRLDLAHNDMTRSHGLFEQVRSAQGNSLTSSFIQCALICSMLRMRRTIYSYFERPEGQEGVIVAF